MATITRCPPWRHLRSGPNHHVLLFRNGTLRRSGRGLAFWFYPLSASVAEIPCDDRDQPFLFQGRSRDHQDVTVQGTITFRVVEPEELAQHIDFSIDLNSGLYLMTPLEQLSERLTQLAQQLAWDYLNQTPIRELLVRGLDEVRGRIRKGLESDANLAGIGLQIVSVQVADLSPNSDLEKALQAPTREAIQQESDEAVFHRRAMAVEKERAIAENELRNRIELARREEELIAQSGQNRQRAARETAEASRIKSEAAAERRRMGASAKAESIRVVEQARVEADAARMDVYRALPPHVMWGLAAREMAGRLSRIDHLNLGTDGVAPLLANLLQAGTRHLEATSDDDDAPLADFRPPANDNYDDDYDDDDADANDDGDDDSEDDVEDEER